MLGGWVHNFISILSEKVWDCSKDYCFVVIVSYYSGIIINAPIILWRQKWKPLYILLSKAATIFSNIQQALLSRAVCFFFKFLYLYIHFFSLKFLTLAKAYSPYLYSQTFLFFYLTIKVYGGVTGIPSLCIFVIFCFYLLCISFNHLLPFATLINYFISFCYWF